MRLLVDTCVIIYYFQRDPSWEGYSKLLKDHGAKELTDWVICFATAQELFLGSILHKQKTTEVADFLQRCLIAPLTLTVCYKAAQLRNLVGKTKERKWHDIWIAATALDHGLTLVTNNAKDFKPFVAKPFNLKLLTTTV